MKTSLMMLIALAAVIAGGCVANAEATPPASSQQRAITFNGTALSPRGSAQLRTLEAHYRTRLPDGAYWYDRRSGAFGRWGGPTAGFIAPNLSLGGRLPARASGSRLNVYINGRAIHPVEYQWFTTLFGRAPIPGRYWLDHQGNIGKLGVPGSINLVAMMRQRGKRDPRWSKYMPGLGGKSGIGLAGDGRTTCVNTANYTRCY